MQPHFLNIKKLKMAGVIKWTKSTRSFIVNKDKNIGKTCKLCKCEETLHAAITGNTYVCFYHVSLRLNHRDHKFIYNII